MVTLSTFVKERSVEYSGMFTKTRISVLHETWDSLNVKNCQFQ